MVALLTEVVKSARAREDPLIILISHHESQLLNVLQLECFRCPCHVRQVTIDS